MTPVEMLAKCAPLQGYWFHSIELSPGVWTNGAKTREQMDYELSSWGFPNDLTGKTVLDIGCADGGSSIAALNRGAKSVLAIDEQVTTGRKLIMDAKAFPKIEFRTMNLFSNEFMLMFRFDFVIFAGVLYHVQDMLEALKRVRSRCADGGSVLIETHVNESAGTTPPLAIFYEAGELANDPTNWWGPNIACLEGMFRTSGFSARPTNLIWENSTRANGRVSYLLDAVGGSIFAQVTGSATGSNSLLEEARHTIARLASENAQLRAQLG